MRIERSFVLGCKVYTKFVGRRAVVVDEFDTPERALSERKMLIYLNKVFNKEVA